MELTLFILCWTPVILLTLLAVVFRRPALELSIYSLIFTLLLTVFFFNTPLILAILTGLDGVATALPLILVIFTGILLSTLLMATGSLKRIVDWLMGGVRDAYHRNLLITLGVSNFMEGASVIAEPVVAPMLYTAGVSPAGAAALSIIGYSGLMTLELTGIIITVLSLVTGIPIQELGIAAAWLSIPATLAMAACVPMYLPESGGIRGMALTLACGLFLGIAALGATVFIGVSISGMVAGLALIFCLILLGNRKPDTNAQVLKDMTPFAFMLATLLLINIIPYLNDLTFRRLTITVNIIPVHKLTFQPFFSAYIYLFLAFGLAAYLLKVPKKHVQEILQTAMRKGWRPLLAMGLFGAMGQIVAYSGYAQGFARLDQAHNIPWVLSHGLKLYTGNLYPVFVPLLGWVGTFLTGYGVASLMLFGQLQIEAANILGVSATWLAAGLAVGASVGSISSPFKVAMATSMCNAIGTEGEILGRTIPLGLAASLFIGLILWIVL